MNVETARTYTEGIITKQKDLEAGRAVTLRESMRQYEKTLICQALQRTEGSVMQAARLLGLPHQALIAIIERRHRDLLTERRLKVRRRRAVFKKK